MDNLRTIAEKYYIASSDKSKKIVKAFIDGLDKDGNGKVNYYEFKQSLKEQGYKKYASNDLFDGLHKNRDEDLEFSDLLTLYYIIMSGRPFCYECDRFIPAEYFGCKECFENESKPVCVCPTCYEKGNFYKTHSHGKSTDSALFLDTYALLESQRLALLVSKRVAEVQSKRLADLEKAHSQTLADLEVAESQTEFVHEMAQKNLEQLMLSSSRAIVLASTSRQKRGKFLSTLKAGLSAAGMGGCTIM